MRPADASAVLAEARTWLRTPWMHASDVRGAGVDCVMLLARVYEAAGLIPHVDPRPYPIDWYLHRDEERCLAGLLQFADEVAQPQPADVALYRIGRCFAHCAIVVDWPHILHAYRGEGVVLARGDGGRLAGREVRFFRVRGGG